MAQGYLSIVLHAHLPYVRHPEHERFLEEQWLFEALTETYLPLLRMLERLEDDGVDYGLLVSLSPTLLTMFRDELLQDRYVRHLQRLIALADREVARTADDEPFQRLARWYADFFRDALYWYEERYQRRVDAAFQHLAAMGHLELMTCAATHGLLPLLKDNPAAVRAQIRTAVEYHQAVFGVHPRGLWIPECAYYPGLEELLAEAGIAYFFVDSHGLERASDRPRYGLHAPVYTPNGVAVFARDRETSYQVWAADIGYPGHPDYREFYRDIGHDLDADLLTDFLIDGRIRVDTGIKYYRVTDREGEHKEPYDVDQARERAAEHAGNFVFNREKQVEHLADQMDRPPLIVSPYDAELFGHWWFEGPRFLECVLRKICYDQETVRTLTPRRYLQLYPENQVATPAGSSWGGDGTYATWLNPTNDAIVRDLHHAADRLTALVDHANLGAADATERWGAGRQPVEPPRAPADRGPALRYRVLQQMMRELLLAQASDWPFILRTGTSTEYAQERVKTHLARFRALDEMLASGSVDEETLEALSYTDRIFPDIRPEHYSAATVAS